MTDESMSSIHFCTNPKGYLRHYSYIFRKLETLGAEFNNFSCYRLGTMLYLYIQNGEEATKTSEFQHEIGVTVAFMKIIRRVKKGFVKLSSNDT